MCCSLLESYELKKKKVTAKQNIAVVTARWKQFKGMASQEVACFAYVRIKGPVKLRGPREEVRDHGTKKKKAR